ncbi:MAG: T9SS type A sorting domain-containing protein, partial [Bacteroidota bacterium]
DSSFYWYTNQSLIPVAHALFDDTGLHDVNYYKSTVSGVTEQNTAASFSLYPNPAENVLHLQLSKNNTVNNVKIFNFYGQLVMESTAVIDVVDVSRLTKGMYVIQVIDFNGNVSANRFVKD